MSRGGGLDVRVVCAVVRIVLCVVLTTYFTTSVGSPHTPTCDSSSPVVLCLI